MTARLVVLSGLPGSGKTAIAEALAREIGAPVFAKDWLEAPILQSGAVARDQLGMIGYALLTTLARRQLAFGQSAILDSVASLPGIRSAWRELAREYEADWRVIECVCSDEAVHRERLGARRREIPGWPELEWSEVERVRGYYAAWQEERLVLDSIAPFDENVARAMAHLGSG